MSKEITPQDLGDQTDLSFHVFREPKWVTPLFAKGHYRDVWCAELVLDGIPIRRPHYGYGDTPGEAVDDLAKKMAAEIKLFCESLSGGEA